MKISPHLTHPYNITEVPSASCAEISLICSGGWNFNDQNFNVHNNFPYMYSNSIVYDSIHQKPTISARSVPHNSSRCYHCLRLGTTFPINILQDLSVCVCQSQLVREEILMHDLFKTSPPPIAKPNLVKGLLTEGWSFTTGNLGSFI